MNTDLILESVREHIKLIDKELDGMDERRSELQSKKQKLLNEINHINQGGAEK